MTIDTQQFLEAFIVEAGEHLEEFEATLLILEKEPGNSELINTIFRCAHSIKGGAATFGLPEVARFTHVLETLLDECRNGKAALNPALLLKSVDQIRALIAVSKGEQTSAPNSDELMAALQAASQIEPTLSATPVQAEPENRVTRYQFRYVPSGDVMARGGDPLIPLVSIAERGDLTDVRCDVSRLPSIDLLDPHESYLSWEGTLETDFSRSEIEELFEFVAEPGDLVLNEEVAEVAVEETNPAKAEPAQAKHDASILRVPAEKMDRLVNLVGELVIAQSMLNGALEGFTMDRLPRLADAVAGMERTCREMQERVMSVRMVPLRHAFGRFPRLVRDLGQMTGKNVELFMSGEDTELDKTLIEAIVDPLTHLVRNAVDHGLETPEGRKAAGKPEVGRLSIVAWHEGGSVVIEVSDDGAGLNRDRILAKAIERGLVSKDGPVLTDEAIDALIFHPGFSTASEVTALSGRGVGMDIVKNAIADLSGSVTVSTKPGHGSTFRIRLPLTMAILEGLSLRIGAETYVVQLTSIVESIRPAPKDLLLVAGQQEVVRVREDVLPILRIHRYFDIPNAIENPVEAVLVIVESEGVKVALLVDELVGQSQAVVKSLESNYQKVDGVTGATILGDGTVALILDIPGLVQGASESLACAA